MPTVAYIANQFPSPVEPYVADEIRELRGRGVQVIACSARRPQARLDGELQSLANETLYLSPLQLWRTVQAAWLCMREFPLLADLLRRVLIEGLETPSKRVRALLHTGLGAYLALQLKGRGVEHIHAHHGYFVSWVAMVAARLSGASFSVTLHGSDLLLHASYLDVKLKHCKFCFTVSEFNRRHVFEHYCVPEDKIVVRRMGVAAPAQVDSGNRGNGEQLILLAVGRLHPVKDHAFLVRACRELRQRGVRFICLVAGEGPERGALELLIRDLRLENEVRLLGQISRRELAIYYTMCDLVVLTSRSEGLPLVLMEAMSYGRLVLAPAITGIPELIEDGCTGFLYRPGSLKSFVSKVEFIVWLQPALGVVRRQARQRVLEHFNREKNLATFADLFLDRLGSAAAESPYENPVLQQI
jgi:glycosyltransferase involved in cell wall biosynthesis